MNEMVSLSAHFHAFFVVLFLALLGVNIYHLKSKKTFSKLSKWLELLAPQYFVLLGAIFFTGLLILAVRQFALTHSVWLMLIVWLFFIIHGIKAHKKYKKLERTEIKEEAYKAFAIKKYTIDILLLIVTMLAVYGSR